MNGLFAFLEILTWAFLFLVLPVLLGVALCRALRVKEYAGQTAAVLASIFIMGLLPFALKVKRTDVYAYSTAAGEWISAEQVKEVVDPESKQVSAVDSKSEKPVIRRDLLAKDIKQEGEKWVLAK
ncbi:MAG: hypothetical protein JSS02_33855, partial [Planctomycetes bacterium]|nr:hypothetical protein [Planctomycetota bacterium]